MSQNPRVQQALQDRAKQVAADLEASRQQQDRGDRGLDATQPVQPTFNERTDPSASNVVEPSSPGPTPRTTSYAKTLDEGYQTPADALKTIPQVQSQFQDQIQSQGQGQGDQQDGRTEGESEMVTQDKPEPEPSNKTPEGQAAKAATYNSKLQNEYNQAAALNERAQQVAADLKASRDQQQPDRQPGQGMG